jgi:hypothetical protein
MAKIFIAFNQADKEIAYKLRKFLMESGHSVTMDYDDAKAGDNLSEFLKAEILANPYIIGIFSENSMLDSWSAKELVAQVFAEMIERKDQNRFIPFCIDDRILKNGFYLSTLKKIDSSIAEQRLILREVEAIQGDTKPVQFDINRLSDLRAALGTLIYHLKNSRVINNKNGFGEILQSLV